MLHCLALWHFAQLTFKIRFVVAAAVASVRSLSGIKFELKLTLGRVSVSETSYVVIGLVAVS